MGASKRSANCGQRDRGPLTLLVPTESVKWVGSGASKVEDGIVPFIVVQDGTVEDGRIPSDIRSHDDMGELIEFLISVHSAL
jgi:hypothetical protein